MRSIDRLRLCGIVVSTVAAFSAFPATSVAQGADHDWSKVYQVSGKPALTLQTDDAALEVHPCGGCQTVRISVHSDRKLSDYVLEEHQDQSRVTFRLREKPGMHFSFGWNGNNKTKVTVETPSNLSLDARVSDGSIAAHGLEGEFQVRSSDGSVSLEDMRGNIDASTSDGSVAIHRSSGQVQARSSDGSVEVDGRYDKVILRTDDGSLKLALAQGSQLTQASQIESSDGGVSIRLPQAMNADLDVRASDGSIQCDLPLKMDGYMSKSSSDHHIEGHLNAGGVRLSVRTSDGSVRISGL